MWVLDIVETAVVVLIIAFFVTQIFIPAFRNRPWFPLFKKQNRELTGRLEEARGGIDEALTEREIAISRERARSIREGRIDVEHEGDAPVDEQHDTDRPADDDARDDDELGDYLDDDETPIDEHEGEDRDQTGDPGHESR